MTTIVTTKTSTSVTLTVADALDLISKLTEATKVALSPQGKNNFGIRTEYVGDRGLECGWLNVKILNKEVICTHTDLGP
jgi:hypothetical protein